MIHPVQTIVYSCAIMMIPVLAFGQLDVRKEAETLEVCGEVYSAVEEIPEYPGGWEALKEVVDEISIGLNCLHIEKAYAYFTIDRSGTPIGIQIPEVDDSCSVQFAESFIQLPKWTPGKLRGENVCVKIVMPVAYKRKIESR